MHWPSLTSVLDLLSQQRNLVPSQLVLDFFKLILIIATEQDILLVLPQIQRFAFPELPDLIDDVFTVIAEQKQTKKLQSFVSQIRIPEFITCHEPQILELIHGLITFPEPDLRLVDELFSSLGRNRTDAPSRDIDALSPFWRFVYDHRDFISSRIDDRPQLLETTYAFMSFARHLLSFQARTRQLQSNLAARRTDRPFVLSVRRAEILEDSFGQLVNEPPQAWLGRWCVRFVNEPGVDGGGLYREWFASIIRQIFNADYALFLPTLSGRGYQPNPASGVNPRHLRYFEFAGKVIAVSLIVRVHLSAHLAVPFLKQLIGETVAIDDLIDIDDGLHKAMKWLLDNSVSSLPDEMFFVADKQDIGLHQQIELKPNGAAIPVTDENKAEFVALMVDYRLRGRTAEQFDAFSGGFQTFVTRDDLAFFDAQELDRLICGEGRIDVADWMRNCEFSGQYCYGHPVIERFFRVISGWGQEELARLLQFMTGNSQVPLGGFAGFRAVGTPITIASVPGNDRLVSAHTCVNTLDLPAYETDEEMNERLLFAVNNCADYGFN
jgi:E3 ubiquitin-protein ligase HUWE1